MPGKTADIQYTVLTQFWLGGGGGVRINIRVQGTGMRKSTMVWRLYSVTIRIPQDNIIFDDHTILVLCSNDI